VCARERTISPASGSTMPRMIFSSVDLPAPLGPTMAMRSSSPMRSERSRKRYSPPYCLSTWLSVIRGGYRFQP
jgi:hypothetical protein